MHNPSSPAYRLNHNLSIIDLYGIVTPAAKAIDLIGCGGGGHLFKIHQHTARFNTFFFSTISNIGKPETWLASFLLYKEYFKCSLEAPHIRAMNSGLVFMFV